MNREAWTPERSEELYGLPRWGRGYFRCNGTGNLEVVPDPGRPGVSVDLKELVEALRRRGIPLPLVVRFDGILEHRVKHLFGCFERSIGEYGYRGRYRGVYPIKVNQQRHVVDVLLRAGRPFGLGVEVGSKPELLAVLAVLDDPDALLICNGYKDRAFLETALLATRLNRNPVVVVERFRELQELIELSQQHGIPPTIGLRAKLATRGSGRWESSGGERSKFGLSPREMVEAVELLRQADLLDSLKLLHFHIGSQITAISNLKQALREGTRIFVELYRLGAPLTLLDVGGGLGVDYDGSKTAFTASTNYSDQEYSNDVVWTVQEICEEAGVPHPDLVSESGRALTAHHSVLVADVLGSTLMTDRPAPEPPATDAHAVLRNLWDSHQAVSNKNYREMFHDVNTLKEEALTLFHHGILSLPDKALADEIAASTYTRILRIVRTLDPLPDDFEHLERDLSDTFFCNLSIFRSLPDCWAIKHTFPVVPLQGHRHHPTRHAVLADITCDSDGKVDRFIGQRDVEETLHLHALGAEQRYSLGFFLVGAYQEILGDPHNLFGDTSAVSVEVAEDGSYEIRQMVEGDRVRDVLGQVEFQQTDLEERFRLTVEKALKAGSLSYEEAALLRKRFRDSLEGYTYPEV